MAVPEMAAEVMNWERLMFEPTWRDDLVWMGWTDESRSRNRLLDLSLGRVREEEPGSGVPSRTPGSWAGGGLHLL